MPAKRRAAPKPAVAAAAPKKKSKPNAKAVKSEATAEGDAAAGGECTEHSIAVFEHETFIAENKSKNLTNAKIYEDILMPAIEAIKADQECFWDWDTALPLRMQEDSADVIDVEILISTMPMFCLRCDKK